MRPIASYQCAATDRGCAICLGAKHDRRFLTVGVCGRLITGAANKSGGPPLATRTSILFSLAQSARGN